MCVLRASGATFEPEEFLNGSDLGHARVFHAGDVRADGKVAAESGLAVSVSDKWELADQVADAIRFLERYRHALGNLAMVATVTLDFKVALRIDGQSVVAQFERFPPELVSRAGALRLALELSIYPISERQTPTAI
jgi:hypothetical protein